MDNNEENLEKMRHSASHVLAQAVLKLYPDTKLGIGPAIENGFTMILNSLNLLKKKI